MDELREGAREGGLGEGTCPHHRTLHPRPILAAWVPAPHLPRPLRSLGPSASCWEAPSPSWVSSGSGQGSRSRPEEPGGQSPPPQSPARKPRLRGLAIRTPRPALPTGLETRARLASTCRRPPGRPWAHRRAHAARTHRPRASLPVPDAQAGADDPPARGRALPALPARAARRRAEIGRAHV